MIQTRGIGDIIIALPIADFFIEQGCEVHWPIDARFVSYFRDAKPDINFIPVTRDMGEANWVPRFFLDDPLRSLQSLNCSRIIPLYAELKGSSLAKKEIADSLKFDEFKYAIAGVPFSRKWKLQIRRNPARELALHKRLSINRPYMCVHATGSNRSVGVDISPELKEKYQIVEVRELTDNPFDWIYTLEHAEKLVLLDSCFSNLVDQLNLQVSKSLILRSKIHDTPVLLNGWEFLSFPSARGRG